MLFLIEGCYGLGYFQCRAQGKETERKKKRGKTTEEDKHKIHLIAYEDINEEKVSK
jgi:hypothetical protein